MTIVITPGDWRGGVQDKILRPVCARGEHRRRAPERSDNEGRRGLIDADLGGNLIKQRVARRGQGRSGGFRVLIAYRTQGFSVFLYGFAKRDRDNLDAKEIRIVRDLAEAWLRADAQTLALALREGQLIEVET